MTLSLDHLVDIGPEITSVTGSINPWPCDTKDLLMLPGMEDTLPHELPGQDFIYWQLMVLNHTQAYNLMIDRSSLSVSMGQELDFSLPWNHTIGREKRLQVPGLRLNRESSIIGLDIQPQQSKPFQ